MQINIRAISKMAVIALLVGAGSHRAHAGAVITNPSGTVSLGVNDAGHLNFTDGILTAPNGAGGAVGVSIIDGGVRRDSTSPGCLCEGWGVSGSGVSGYANISTDGGVNNLTVDSFTSTATTATSTVHVGTLPDLVVTQAYAPAAEAPDVLFRDLVTITNTGAVAITDVRYVRVMDWDVPPTEFAEFVTIAGTASTTLLARSHDNGFNTANPLGGDAPIIGSTVDVDFADVGPADHGAYFRFDFGTLAAGESKTFSVYYGAGFSEASVLGALGDVGIELYSLGQSGGGAATGTPYTYAFGFKGVGGVVVLPPSGGAVPEPSTYGLIGAAMLGAVVYLRRRKNA
ncbi:MAG TPA: PEP-CTERM sorting domain-containing protein [Opitutaceae bacterium]|nr:PEP-CTERM sorting domain-containing protein [Opitutaceae bacterium]